MIWIAGIFLITWKIKYWKYQCCYVLLIRMIYIIQGQKEIISGNKYFLIMSCWCPKNPTLEMFLASKGKIHRQEANVQWNGPSKSGKSKGIFREFYMAESEKVWLFLIRFSISHSGLSYHSCSMFFCVLFNQTFFILSYIMRDTGYDFLFKSNSAKKAGLQSGFYSRKYCNVKTSISSTKLSISCPKEEEEGE